MTITIEDILGCVNDFAPFWLSESWDNNGLLVGSRKQVVTSILVGLDPSNALLEEAIRRGCDTIITHHPVIFKPLSAIDIDTPTGKFIKEALKNSISVIACHTNLDSAVDGVSDGLGRAIGVSDMRPIIEDSGDLKGTGMGRIGTLSKKMEGASFIQSVLTALDLKSVQVAGVIPEYVSTVAICGGSGSEIAPKTQAMGADVYLTAEVKHSTARWAEETDFCIIDGTHYSTEKFAVSLLHDKLSEVAENNKWQITIRRTETEQHPFASVNIDIKS